MSISPLVDMLWTIAGICEPVPTTMFLTSTKWAILVADVKKVQPTAALTSSSPLLIGCLTVVNLGTEDQAVVDEANLQAANNASFQQKRLALISARGEHDARIGVKSDNPFPRDGSTPMIGDFGDRVIPG